MAMIARSHPEIGPRARMLFAAIATVGLFMIAELVTLASAVFLQSKYKMYAVPVVQHSERIKSYDDYLRHRDPVLGWPFPAEFGDGFYDSSGARHSPAFRDPAKFPNRVAIFGDSYAAGSEVDDDHAWGNQLALMLGSRVGIFGVPGYGTDQAYLRFLSMPKDSSRIVILTHLSEDISRNLTRNWDLFTHMGHYGLKPRFVRNGNGGLVHVPLPNLTEPEYLRSVGIESPFLSIEHENFQPGGPAGVTRLSFPFSVAFMQNLGSFQMRSLFARRPDYAEFYTKGHPLEGLEITAQILVSFQEEARKKGQWPLVVLLATRQDFNYVRKNGTWTYANLITELDRLQVNYLDFGPLLQKHIGDREVRSFFKPLGHYNEEVSKILADTVYETFRSRGAPVR